MNENMFMITLVFSLCMALSMSAIIPQKHRPHGDPAKTHERNCFFTPAQCALTNFPESQKLQPVLQVFENGSLDTIYSKLSLQRTSFFDYRK